jgi:hypothetical protein
MPTKHVLVLLTIAGVGQNWPKIGVRQDANAALGSTEEDLGAAEAECYLVGLHGLLALASAYINGQT